MRNKKRTFDWDYILIQVKKDFSGKLQHSLEELGVVLLSLCSNKSLNLKEPSEIEYGFLEISKNYSNEMSLFLRKFGIGNFKKAVKFNKTNFEFLIFSTFGKNNQIVKDLLKNKTHNKVKNFHQYLLSLNFFLKLIRINKQRSLKEFREKIIFSFIYSPLKVLESWDRKVYILIIKKSINPILPKKINLKQENKKILKKENRQSPRV